MNESHKNNRKLNRYNRLLRKLVDAPLDDKKQSRKRDLEIDLHKLNLLKIKKTS